MTQYRQRLKDKKIVMMLISLTVLVFGIAINSAYSKDSNINNQDLKILTKIESDFGPVWIFEEAQQRCMSFSEPPPHIVQSCFLINDSKILLHDYAKVFLSTLFFVEQPKKILVIGLGGASTQSAFNLLSPTTQIDTVEINKELPAIVEKYFNYKENEINKIFIADGIEFVKTASADQYDIILLDAFDVEYIPLGFLTDEFMQNIRKLLTKNGVVAINTFYNSKYAMLESELFERNFGHYYNVVTKVSRIMIASKSELLTLSELKVNSILLKDRLTEVGINQSQLLNLFNSPV